MTDVIVIGAGGAGLAAATEAAARGTEVLLIESGDSPGGTATTSGGGTFFAGSPLQARLGIVDSADAGIEDWLAWGGDAVDAPWMRRYIEHGTALFEWFCNAGVEWVGLKHHEGNRVPRWHAPKNAGQGVMDALERTARANPRIHFRLNTRLTGLIVEGGRVRGVVVESVAGVEEVRAGATLIATGGFNNNPQMVARHSNNRRLLLGGGGGARGEGHAILDQAGAQFVNLDSIWMYPYATPDYLDPAGERGLIVRGLEGDIWVNRQGRRFHNEDPRGGATGTPALMAQDGSTGFSIIDARIAATFHVADPRYRMGTINNRENLNLLLAESPYIFTGKTIADLAAVIDAPDLPNTVENHNLLISTGVDRDPVFGRLLAGVTPLCDGPFYAIQFFPAARKNLGGVRTNADCQALNRAGQPIAGLFAAGEVAGMAGGHINGRAALEGTMFGPSVFSGRVAGLRMSGDDRTLA